MLTLIHKLIVGKHIADIVIHIIAPIDETNLGFHVEMLYGSMRIHILKGFDS